MKHLTILFVSSVCALLAGCAAPLDRTYVTVSTNPPGAMLLAADNSVLGQEPMRIYWMPQEITAIGPNQWQTMTLTAVWPSGSRTTTSFTYQGEMLQELNGVIVRNMNDPNLHLDMANANQVMQLRQQQQMIEQQSMDNLMRSMQTNSLINTLQGIESRLPPPYYGY